MGNVSFLQTNKRSNGQTDGDKTVWPRSIDAGAYTRKRSC